MAAILIVAAGEEALGKCDILKGLVDGGRRVGEAAD